MTGLIGLFIIIMIILFLILGFSLFKATKKTHQSKK
ncbi:hypothetical protein LAHI110946_01035 [Lactococcus hircilactis]